MDRFDAMRLFQRVVETGNFSAAARDFGIGQPAVSKLISGLEVRLGARLLQRTTRSVTPTDAGLAYYQRCRRLLDDLAEAEAEAAGEADAPRGLLRLSTSVAFGRLHVLPLLPGFLRLHPGVQVDLLMNDSFINLVEEGVDIAIRIGRLEDESVVARRLGITRRVTVATPDYFATHGMPNHPRDLTRHDCVVFSKLATVNEWHFTGPDGAIAVKVRGSFRANNSEAIREAVLSGLGIGVVPTWLFTGGELTDGRLAITLREFEPTPFEIHAVYPTARLVSPKVRALIDHIATNWRESGQFQ